MSLLAVANQIKADGFDPRKDKVNGNQHLPGGEYPVILKEVKARVSDSGWESINYAFEVRDPDSSYNGRTQFVGMGTLTSWKNKNGKEMDLTSLVETTVKFFEKAIEFAGDTLKKSDFEDNKSLEEALKRKAEGSKFLLIINEYTKRDKTTGYNYDLDVYPSSIQEEIGTNPMDISDDDLPF